MIKNKKYTYAAVAGAIHSLRQIREVETGNGVGNVRRLREQLEAQLRVLHPRLESHYVFLALKIWGGTA